MERRLRYFLIFVIILLSSLLVAAVILIPDIAAGRGEPVDIDVSDDIDTGALLITAPDTETAPVSVTESYTTAAGTLPVASEETVAAETPGEESEAPPSVTEAQVKPEADLDTPWYEQYAVVAHALGTVEGRTETNSREAFIESYGNGQRVFEVDLFLTSDDRLVARHDFLDNSYYNLEQVKPAEPVMDYETYMSSLIKYKYTPLDIDGILELLTEYPDAYIITDTKETEYEPVILEFKLLSEAVERIDPSLRERIIVQIYHDDMYDYVSEVYDCKNWIYTLYQLPERDYKKIGAFCFLHNISVITMSHELFSVETLELLHTFQTRVYFHTVNRLMTMLDFTAGGADGFYSDYITPGDLELAMSKSR